MRPTVRGETLALLASAVFTLLCNATFWHTLLTLRPPASWADWRLPLCAALLLTGLQWLMLLLVTGRRIIKPLLMLLTLPTAAAVYFMNTYAVHLDPPMLRNLVETDIKEAGELLAPGMLLYVLYAVIAIGLISRFDIRRVNWRQAALTRAAALLAALGMSAAGLWLASAELIPAIREHKELRYLVTPANYLYSLGRVLTAQVAAPGTAQARERIAPDAQRGDGARKPLALVLVVGETVRAANWGLNDYERQTTPELAARQVINFPEVTSCGTDTAISLPCMFSLIGRQRYDESAIRRQESLLHVLQRVGVSVRWRENQSGCKGVCDGLPVDNLAHAKIPGLCDGERCFDEVLLNGLPQIIENAAGDIIVILHMLGNHGPAYFRRYPENFRQWTPTCDTTDLARCSREALVNTYDNAVLYTDHVLAQAIDQLAQITSHDTALLYVSDHGESLGEKGLYLHGMPYAIAPAEQTRVPMIFWLSPAVAAGLPAGCLARRAAQPASHDHLFHTVLKLFAVDTVAYNPQLDLLADCR